VSFVYFTDRDLGLRFPQILRDSGLTVERHRDHFPPDARDEEWLETAGRLGWVALTHNSRIRYTPNEKDAVMRHAVRLLVIIGRAPYPDLARSFVATRDRIETFLAQHTPPFIAKVYRPSPADLAKDPSAAGRIERWV
jgi:PIN like domain